MSISGIPGYRPQALSGNTELAIQPVDGQADIILSPNNVAQSVEPINEAARIVAAQNRLTGGNNPLLLETEDVLRSISVKPKRTYYHSGTEFYHPQLNLANLLGIGSIYKGKHYQCVAASVSQTQWPIDFSAIYLHLYTDQAEDVYEELLTKHPQEKRKPFEEQYGPKYSSSANFFRSTAAIQKELRQRKEEQKQVIQNVVDHIKRLNDPGIESVYLPTPEERFEKFHCPLQYAALTDAIFIIHKRVPPAEQRGFEAYRLEREAERNRADRIRNDLDYQERVRNRLLSGEKPEASSPGAPGIRPPSIEEEQALRTAGNQPVNAPGSIEQAPSAAPTVAVPEVQTPPQAAPPPTEPPANQNPEPAKKTQGFFLRLWIQFKKILNWLFCCWRTRKNTD